MFLTELDKCLKKAKATRKNGYLLRIVSAYFVIMFYTYLMNDFFNLTVRNPVDVDLATGRARIGLGVADVLHVAAVLRHRRLTVALGREQTTHAETFNGLNLSIPKRIQICSYQKGLK
jgi:hypothetical protein